MVRSGFAISFFWLLSVLSGFGQAAEDDVRIFTNTKGQKLEARVIKLENENVTIKRTDTGAEFTVSTGIFSQADQDWLKAWQKRPKLDLTVLPEFGFLHFPVAYWHAIDQYSKKRGIQSPYPEMKSFTSRNRIISLKVAEDSDKQIATFSVKSSKDHWDFHFEKVAGIWKVIEASKIENDQKIDLLRTTINNPLSFKPFLEIQVNNIFTREGEFARPAPKVIPAYQVLTDGKESGFHFTFGPNSYIATGEYGRASSFQYGSENERKTITFTDRVFAGGNCAVYEVDLSDPALGAPLEIENKAVLPDKHPVFVYNEGQWIPGYVAPSTYDRILAIETVRPALDRSAIGSPVIDGETGKAIAVLTAVASERIANRVQADPFGFPDRLGMTKDQTGGAALDGYWSVVEDDEFPSAIRFVIIENGNITLSNGITFVNCWSKFGDGKFQWSHGAFDLWKLPQASYGYWKSSSFNGFYTIDGDRLSLSSEDSSSDGTPVYELKLQRLSADELSGSALKSRGAESREFLEFITETGARVATNQLGFVTEIDLTHCDATREELAPISNLPHLAKVTAVKDAIEGLLPDTIKSVEPKRILDSRRRRSEFQPAYRELLVQKGLRSRYALIKQRQGSSSKEYNLFSAIYGNEDKSVPSFLIPIGNKNYAIHPRLAGDGMLPKQLTQQNLKGDIELGGVADSRLNFQIREMLLHHDSRWIFDPIPVDSSVLFTGMQTVICRSNDQVTATLKVQRSTADSAIHPGCPVEHGMVKLTVHADIDERQEYSFFPVIDPATGYLLGVTGQQERSGDHIEVEFEPIHDLLRPAGAAEAYDGSVTFFGVPNQPKMQGRLAALQGIFSIAALEMKIGETPYYPLWNERSNVFIDRKEEMFGREYLFSSYKTDNWNIMGKWIGGVYRGQRLDPGDDRIKRFYDFLIEYYGEPHKFSGRNPANGSFGEVNLFWHQDEYSLLYTIDLDRYNNSVLVEFQLEKGKPGFIHPTSRDNYLVETRDTSEKMDAFFEQLNSLPPIQNSMVD